jgi:acyl carrier protein
MALSPDGGLLAVGFYELTFRDAAGGQQRGPALDLPGSEYISRLTFSPDGNLLAVGTSKANILLIDTRTLMQTGRISLAEHRFGKVAVEALAFSPDGSTLASNGFARGSVILWDVASHSSLRTLDHPDASTFVYAVAFSADGKILAMADGHHFIRTGRSGTFNVNKPQEFSIYLWDTETQQPLGPPLKGHTAPITSLAFGPRCAGCPAETSLVSGDARGTLMMWDMSVASWQRRACAISNRRLTDRERARYLKDMSPHEICPASPSFSALTLPPAAAERTPLSRLVKLPPYPMSLLEHLNDPSSDDGVTLLAQARRTIYFEISPTGRDRDGGGEKETTEAKLERIVADKLDERPSSLHFGFKLTEEDGIGAAEKAALLKTVGKEFGFDIPAQDGEKIETFPDLLAYVQRRIDAGNKPK